MLKTNLYKYISQIYTHLHTYMIRHTLITGRIKKMYRKDTVVMLWTQSLHLEIESHITL